MTEPLNDRLLRELRAIVGDEHVLTDVAVTAEYRTDWTRRFGGPTGGVVRPADTAETAAVLAACTRHRATVVAQGGNTGLVGGSVPHDGEIVCSLRRLDVLDAVDVDDGSVVAGAGVTLGALQRHAAGSGWDVPVDLAARDSATLGGMVATNAGGLHAVAFGPMRRHVLGVEAVTARGTLIGRVPGLRKDNTGYDMTGLLCGSEGTLAVVTRVHLSLVPTPPERAVALLAHRSIEDVVASVGSLRRRLPDVVAAELVTADAMSVVDRHLGAAPPLPVGDAEWLLVEVAGPDATTRLAEAIAASTPAPVDAAVASDAPSRARLWRHRERLTEAVAALGVAHKLDVTLPLSAFASFCAEAPDRVRRIRPGAQVVLFGHVGDGNVHVQILGVDAVDRDVDRAVLTFVAERGGSISAEHGVGVAKRDDVDLTRSDDERRLMAAVRRSFDPDGTLNPAVRF